MGKKDSIIQLKKKLKDISKISVISHHNPDGDAIGSILSMYHLLKSEFTIQMVVPSGFPEFLKWLPGSELIINAQKDKSVARNALSDAELIFCMDFNHVNRVGLLSESLAESKATKVLIDHHPQPNMEDFDILFSDTAPSSTAELFYHLAIESEWKDKMSKSFAEACLTGIMTDTGSFSFACDRLETFDAVQGLMKLGAVISEVNRNIYGQIPMNKLQLMGFSLHEKLKMPANSDEIAYISLSTKEMNRFHYRVGDTEGLVNWALGIKGVRMAALITEQKENIKFSFRSVGSLSVNDFARKFFNGGGHTNAAGGKYAGSIEEAAQYFEQQAVEYLKQV